MIKIIGYVARTLSIALIIFCAFFLSDRTVPLFFTGNLTLIRELLTLIIIAISIAAWRIPMLGGIILCIYGIRYFAMIARPENMNTALMLLGFFMVTGLLFVYEGYHTNKGNKPVDKKFWFT